MTGHAKDIKQVRRDCEARLRELPLPEPFSVRALCSLVAEQRGRPIRLMPVTGNHGVWGLWVATDTADLIFYEEATTEPHQEHIILHELSHLLCDHYPAPLAVADHTQLLLPDLDPEMVRRVLGRTTYSVVEEQEAELLASLIWRRAQQEQATRASGVAQGTAPQDPVADPGDLPTGAVGDGVESGRDGGPAAGEDHSDSTLALRLRAALGWSGTDPSH